MNRYLDPAAGLADFTRAEGLYRRAQLSFNQVLATGSDAEIETAETELDCARQTYLKTKAALPSLINQEIP